MKTETAAPIDGQKALPVKVTNEPGEGAKRENCAMVLVRKRMTTVAVSMVRGAASPAPCTIKAKPKKKLMAGAMLASVDATMWLGKSASRRSRVNGPALAHDSFSLTGIGSFNPNSDCPSAAACSRSKARFTHLQLDCAAFRCL